MIPGKVNYRGFHNFYMVFRTKKIRNRRYPWQKEDNIEIVKVDAIDLLFLQHLRQIGFTAFPIGYISKFIININSQNRIPIIKFGTQLKHLRTADSNLQIYIDNLKIIIPHCYYTSEIKTFDDYVQNTNLSIIENLFFF